MEKTQSSQISVSRRDDNINVGPPPPEAQSRWKRVEKPLTNWRYLVVLIVLVIYARPILRSQYGGNSQDRILNDGPMSEKTELWTEWLDITPSEKLKWQPCFGIYGPNLQCARLTVPMDYSRPLNESADNPKVHLALLMATGAGRTEDPSTYAEAPMLVNPGGPGGSGVFFTLGRAASFQLFVGKQHDIIGFDPRGVGASTPKADCFASSDSPNGVMGRNVAYMNRLTWELGGQAIGLTNSSNVALSQLRSRNKAIAKLCQRVDEAEGENSIYRHMGTPNSARDMLSISQAWDEWRSGHKETSSSQPEPASPADGDNNKTSLRGKLVYWGFSYGTLLGATFASMFPDRVGRVVLDGVVHADHYVNPMWDKSVVDADAIWDKFFTYCAEASISCKFYRAGDRPEAIRKRFIEILSALEEQPATVLLPNSNIAGLVTASDIKASVFFAGLYAPIVGFPVIAELLDAVASGRLEEVAKGQGLALFCGNLTLPAWPDDGGRTIACSDKRNRLDENVTELQARFEKAASYSWFADVWFGIYSNLGCNGWAIENKDPPMRWDDHPAHKPTPTKTSFPILFLSNRLDPVTPLGDALAMTRKFANASIVEQDGTGHCTLSCVSSCTIAHLQAYLNDGVVPPSPKFESDTSNDGQWPTCKCFDRPWRSSISLAEEPASVSGFTVTRSHIQAYEELRAHFSTTILTEQLGHNNLLKAYLLERSGQGVGFRRSSLSIE
ncbi:Alpha/Beta hydrolase protein [Nemania sp. FL0916]|nr:Alpha/Beta hydrolase protein [Nemania sp. FL0916]